MPRLLYRPALAVALRPRRSPRLPPLEPRSSRGRPHPNWSRRRLPSADPRGPRLRRYWRCAARSGGQKVGGALAARWAEAFLAGRSAAALRDRVLTALTAAPSERRWEADCWCAFEAA